MNRCKTCKHWLVDRDYWPHEERLRSCASPGWLMGYNHKAVDVPDDGVLVENDEGWGVMMGPEFGCVHWEG